MRKAKNPAVTAIIYEEINWDTSNLLFQVKTQSSYSDIWRYENERVQSRFKGKDFLSQEYFDEMRKPLVTWEEKKMSELNFYKSDDAFFFKTRWQDIKTVSTDYDIGMKAVLKEEKELKLEKLAGILSAEQIEKTKKFLGIH